MAVPTIIVEELESFIARRRRTGAIARRLLSGEGEQSASRAGFMETLVATILSQNTSDRNSHRAWIALVERYDNWSELAAAPPAELSGVIRIAGLAEAKAAAILAALNTIHERYGSFEPAALLALPDDELIAELTSLPGVGLKTAACVLMFALERDICAVDTHVHRVANRLGIVATPSPDATFRELTPLLPKGRGRRFHVALIHFGRDLCKARLPHCFECPLYDLCEWEEKEEHAMAARPGASPISGDLMLLDIIHERSARRARSGRRSTES